jgi:two-component system nitrate/nitrite response regulator NarL
MLGEGSSVGVQITQLRYGWSGVQWAPWGADMSARVLIVDDQCAFRQVARGLLEHRGYTVVGEAADATAAVDAATRLRPDAVLLDVRLGEDDGFAVARALARACPGAAVLLVSNDDYHHHTERVKSSGALGFTLKSQLAVADLAACLRRADEQPG